MSSSATRKPVNMRNWAVKRIMQEAAELADPDTDDFVAAPLESDIFEWHCTVRGVQGTDYEGGLYHLRILLPSSYPMSAPDIILMTPNGRFELNKKICIDGLTSFHAGSWQPAWGVRTAITGLRSFWTQDGEALSAIGALDLPKDERRRLAKLSRDWTCPTCGESNVALLPDPVKKPKEKEKEEKVKATSSEAAAAEVPAKSAPAAPEAPAATTDATPTPTPTAIPTETPAPPPPAPAARPAPPTAAAAVPDAVLPAPTPAPVAPANLAVTAAPDPGVAFQIPLEPTRTTPVAAPAPAPAPAPTPAPTPARAAPTPAPTTAPTPRRDTHVPARFTQTPTPTPTQAVAATNARRSPLWLDILIGALVTLLFAMIARR